MASYDSGFSFDAKKASTGLDPVTIGLIGASALGSLFGGDDGQQQKRTFSHTAVDPVMTLRDVLDSIKRMGMALGEAPPIRSGVSLRAPTPISIPGIPFQIGGGMGANPDRQSPSYIDPWEMASQIFKPMRGGQQQGLGPQNERTHRGILGTMEQLSMSNPQTLMKQDQRSRL